MAARFTFLFRTWWTSAVAAALLGWLLTACLPASTPQPEVITTRMTALLTGEVTLDGDCLRVAGYLLAWPPEFTVEVQGGTVSVLDGYTGDRAAWHLGDAVEIGGGEARLSGLAEPVRARLPEGCAGPYWLAGGVAIEEYRATPGP